MLASPQTAAINPLVAGALARCVSASLVSPLELIRTQIQARVVIPGSPPPSVAEALKGIFRQEGVTGLWRGLSATLARDVPFSAVYWGGYESMKRAFTPEEEAGAPPSFRVAFAAGALS